MIDHEDGYERGYRAGIEAALTVVAEEEVARRDWEETDKASALSVAWDRIRALSPAAPDAPDALALPQSGEGERT